MNKSIVSLPVFRCNPVRGYGNAPHDATGGERLATFRASQPIASQISFIFS